MTDNDARGWTGSPSTSLRWRVLRALVASPDDGRFVTAFALADELGVDARSVGHAFQELASAGLAGVAAKDMGHDFHTDARPTPKGATTVERWDAAGRSKLLAACSSALLSWLDTLSNRRQATTEAFLADVRGSYFGQPFDRGIVHQVVGELREQEVIKAMGSAQDPMLMAELTPTGRRVLARFDGDVEEWQHSRASGGPSISLWHSPGANVAQNSPHAQQVSVITSEARDQLLAVAAAAKHLLPDLPLDDEARASALEQVDALTQVASDPAGSPTAARRVLTTLRDIGINAAGSAGGTAIVMLATQALSSLPL